MNDLARWLDGRRPPAPESLRRALLDAIQRGDPGAGSLPDRLAAAGLEALARVAALPSTRSRALELLAADALLTYACEAALDEDAGLDALERLTAGLDMGRFAELREEVPSR